MQLQDLFDLVKPKTQDLDAYVYFDSNGLIYEPNRDLKIYVKDADDRLPTMIKVGDLSSRINETSVPDGVDFSFNNVLNKEYANGEIQESAVNVLNAIASYGNTLYCGGSIICKDNILSIMSAGMQYILYHESRCSLPDFRINISLRTWGILYHLHQLIKDNKVKKCSYYTVGILKDARLTFNNDNLYLSLAMSDESINPMFEKFKQKMLTDSHKYLGEFDRKYINDSEKNVKLKHLLKTFDGNIKSWSHDKIKIFSDDFTKLYFL